MLELRFENTGVVVLLDKTFIVQAVMTSAKLEVLYTGGEVRVFKEDGSWEVKAVTSDNIVDSLNETIVDLTQQLRELHASRESLLEYKAKLENPDYVLVPRDLSIYTLEAMWTQFHKRPDMQMVHNAIIKESQEQLE